MFTSHFPAYLVKPDDPPQEFFQTLHCRVKYRNYSGNTLYSKTTKEGTSPSIWACTVCDEPIDFGIGQTPVDMNLIIAHVQRTMAGGDGSANKKPAVDKGTLYNMCCLVSNKTAYAEEKQTAAKDGEAKKDATNANEGKHESPLPAAGKNVNKTSGSPSYSPCLSSSEDGAAMVEKNLKDAVEDPSKTSPPKDGTPTAQPMPKKDSSASKPPSPEVSPTVGEIVDKHGFCAVDSDKKDAELIDELREDYEWYKLQDKDKELGFKDMVNRHASSLTLT